MDTAHQSIRVSVDAEPIDVARVVQEVGRPIPAPRSSSWGRCATTPMPDRMSPTSNTRSTPELVEPKIREIVEEAAGRWPMSAVVEHRSGTVSLGEVSVAVAVSTAHREDAFVAGRFIIDELKTRAPIWKKEHWPGGSEWSAGS